MLHSFFGLKMIQNPLKAVFFMVLQEVMQVFRALSEDEGDSGQKMQQRCEDEGETRNSDARTRED